MMWWRRARQEEPRLTGRFVRKDARTGKYVCAGCGPWCEDHGWKDPVPTGNPEADLAAAKAFAGRVTAYIDATEGRHHSA